MVDNSGKKNTSYTEYYKKRVEATEKALKEKKIKRKEVKEIEKKAEDPTPTIEFLSLPNHVKFVKLALTLLAVLLIAFIFYRNFVSSEDFNYFYDIGDNENYLSPASRVSLPSNGTPSYRNLTSGLVYFNVDIPRGAESVDVEIRFKDNFSESLLILGAKNQEDWHYEWHTLFDKEIEDISSSLLPNQQNNLQIFKINPNLENKNLSQIQESNDLIIASSVPITKNAAKVNFTKDRTIINTALRGGHTFYIYTQGELDLFVEKQDLNWYNGSDELKVSIYDSTGELVTEINIPDDGIIDSDVDKNSIESQEAEIFVPNLPEGVYRIVFSDFDGIIRQIDVNTDKIVAADKLYLADSPVFFSDLGMPTSIYTNFYRNSSISFRTWHDTGLQNITINSYNLNVDQKSNESFFQSTAGEYNISIKKNDLIVSAPGYFAFSKENYFEPFTNRIIPFRNDYDWLNSDVDYLIVDYTPPMANDGGWIVSKTSFNVENLYIKDNKLNMVLNTPHLAKDEYKNYTIPIDWINITVHKPGFKNGNTL